MLWTPDGVRGRQAGRTRQQGGAPPQGAILHGRADNEREDSRDTGMCGAAVWRSWDVGSETFRDAAPDEAVQVLEDPDHATDGVVPAPAPAPAPVPSGRLLRAVQRAAEPAGVVDRPCGLGDLGAPPPRSQDDLERVSVRNVASRLRAAHPLVDAATVEAMVRKAYDSFDGARVRAYVPILVERRCRRALRAAFRTAPPGGVADESAPQAGGDRTATAAAVEGRRTHQDRRRGDS